MARKPRSAVTATQRVYRLKLFLLEHGGLFTHRDIRGAVADYQGEGGSATRSKKLERDLELIAKTGWELKPEGFREVFRGREQLYRLRVSDSLLPLQHADGRPAFTPKQLALLRASAESLHSSVYHDDALEILMRITAAEERFAVQRQHLPVALEKQHVNATARAAYRAMRQQKQLQFHYYAPKYRERPGDAMAVKQISVWRVESLEGKLFIIGFDHRIGEPRTYLLDRIGEHRQLNLKAKPAVDELLQRAKDAFWQHREEQTATLVIDPDQPGAKSLLALPDAAHKPLREVVGGSVGKARALLLTLKTHDLRLLAASVVQHSEAVLEVRTPELREAVGELLNTVIDQHSSAAADEEVLAQLMRERKTDLRGAAGALTQQQKSQLAESLLFMRPEVYPLAELANALGLHDSNSNIADLKAVCEVLETSYDVRVLIEGDAEELTIEVLESAGVDRFYGFNRRHTTVLSYPLQRLAELLSGDWLVEHRELLKTLGLSEADPEADPAVDSAILSSNLQTLFSAALTGETVRFNYLNLAAEASQHSGVPKAIFEDNGDWLLRMWSPAKQQHANYRCRAIIGAAAKVATAAGADPQTTAAEALTPESEPGQHPQADSLLRSVSQLGLGGQQGLGGRERGGSEQRPGQVVAVVASPPAEWTLNSRDPRYFVARESGNSVALVTLFDYASAAVTLVKRAPGQVWLPILPPAEYAHGVDPAVQDYWRDSVLTWARELQRRLVR